MIRIEVSDERITDVQEVRKASRDLQKHITELVRNFEGRTGCPVVSIDECRASAAVYWMPRVVIGS